MSGKLEKHLRETGTVFTVVTNRPELRASIKETVPDLRLWAWIDHEPDDENGSPHTHFIVSTNGTRTIKAMADKLGIQGNYVQVVKKITAMYRYLIHKDNPEKRQYSIDDIHSNHIEDIASAINGERKKDPNSLFVEYTKLSLGMMTTQEFIQSNFVEISKMNFYQKIQTFQAINKIACTRTT